MKDAFKLDSMILLYTYHIRASYETKRGNKKERIFAVDGVNEKLVQTQFYLAISSHNESNKNKPFLNVEILSVAQVKTKIVYSNSDGTLSVDPL